MMWADSPPASSSPNLPSAADGGDGESAGCRPRPGEVDGLKPVYGGLAYRMADIRRVLSERQAGRLERWLWGQTRPGGPDDDLVYTTDYDDWRAGIRLIFD